MEREDGYYWVKKDGGWRISTWTNKTFLPNEGLWDTMFHDIWWEEIDERRIIRS